MLTRTLILVVLALGSLTASAGSEPELPMEFAYRNPTEYSAAARRVVSLQGDRSSSETLVSECGATGSACACDFYRHSSDTAPVMASSIGISEQNNTISCTIPASITDAQIDANLINFVKLRRTDSTNRNTGLLVIKRTLLLEDVLGTKLAKSKVRGIFRYSCAFTFFEGEGVSPHEIMCMGGQRLGVISARYNFYTYRSGEDRNEQGGDAAFPDPICGRNSFLRYQCTGNTPELRYGFYKEQAGPFVAGITMTRAPEGENLTSLYGFAAIPDSAGNCAPGLVKIRPWLAQPASITDGSLGDNPSSNFINSNNTLNNVVIEPVQPMHFSVWRQPNVVPCSADGSCNSAEFGGMSQVQSVEYVALTPVVCAIPSHLLTGIF